MSEQARAEQLNSEIIDGWYDAGPVSLPEGERAPDRRGVLDELGERLEEAMAAVDAAWAPFARRGYWS